MDEQKIANGIIELKEDVKEIRSQMMTQTDKHEILDAIANLTTLVKKIDDDHVFAIEWLKRLQENSDKQQAIINQQQKVIDQQVEEIKQIKLHLGMA